MLVRLDELTTYRDSIVRAEFCSGKKIRNPEKTMKSLLQKRHSPCYQWQLSFYCYAIPERVWSHLCKHHIGTYIFTQTQRPDLIPEGMEVKEGFRNFMIDINPIALFQVFEKRACSHAWGETQVFMNLLKGAILDYIETNDMGKDHPLQYVYDHCQPFCGQNNNNCREGGCEYNPNVKVLY